jgi:hypothetical protein
MRLWSFATRLLGGPVTIVNVWIHSPYGFCQPSQRPPELSWVASLAVTFSSTKALNRAIHQ